MYLHTEVHLLANLGRVDFDLGFSIILLSQFCQSPLSPSKIKVNPTEVCQEMDLPVHV